MSAPMRQRGMALLSVLLLTAVMTVLAVAMLDDIRFGLRRTGNAHAIAQAQRYALGSEALARQRLGELQRGGVDAAQWNGQPLLFPIVEDGQTLGLVRARLGDCILSEDRRVLERLRTLSGEQLADKHPAFAALIHRQEIRRNRALHCFDILSACKSVHRILFKAERR